MLLFPFYIYILNELLLFSVAIPNEQVNYALPLVKEVLILLNGLPEGEVSVAVLNSVTSWLSLNKTSPLLLPCIKVSSQSLNSVLHKARLIECCISTRFRDGKLLTTCFFYIYLFHVNIFFMDFIFFNCKQGVFHIIFKIICAFRTRAIFNAFQICFLEGLFILFIFLISNYHRISVKDIC